MSAHTDHPATPDKDLLIGFPCAHIFHLPCLLNFGKAKSDLPEVLASFSSPYEEGYDRSIGPKVDHAALLRTMVGDGCPVAIHGVDNEG